MNDTANSPAALRWRCRRGMRELDVLLGRWLEDSWPDASIEFRQAFVQLLECEDDQIWDWLMGRTEPAQELLALVDDIRSQSERARP